jgi:hypothetical protein
MSDFERILYAYADALNNAPAVAVMARHATVLGHVSALEADLSRAIELLHMLDNQDARHPDVAAFLDEYEGR